MRRQHRAARLDLHLGEAHGDASGYSQAVRWNAAGELVQATTVRNAAGSHDVVVAVVAGDWRALVGISAHEEETR